ncbi:MAG: glycosyltransferase [Balneolaceae bacterium]|nr:glycosyltransferase [Balneolaceae bacterium]
MMLSKPRLSIILCFSGEQDVIEPTLNTLYGLKEVPFELFLVDDRHTEESRQVIQSLLDFHGHEQTYYYEHPAFGGRGLRISEVLPQCNTPYIWCPESAGEIDGEALMESLDLLEQQKLAFLTSASLPDSTDGWLELAGRDQWPEDGHFLWNFDVIDAASRFFNPEARHYPGLGLAARLQPTYAAALVDPFQQPCEQAKREPLTPSVRRELLGVLMKRYDADGADRKRLYERYEEYTREGVEYPGLEGDLLVEAKNLKEAGRFSGAMELVEHVLKRNPDHSAAKKLKMEILEKRRRFVEASEIKHELEWRSTQTRRRTAPGEFKTSVIIPTTAHGKPALEHCLLNLSNHCDSAATELIVVDNASLDNTHDYLEELKEKNFLNCKVITNSQNMGFAASVNQGLKRAGGTYACILHNDVEIKGPVIRQLENYLDENPDYGMVGPLANKTLYPEQATRAWEEPKGLQPTEILDSFCMMMRTGMGVEMDESFELAFFEDFDLCFQIRDKGYRVGLATDVSVTHYLGTTTFALDLDIDSPQYYKNVAFFNEKWDIDVYSEEKLRAMGTFDQLLALDELVNPLFPEPSLQAWYKEIFTDELRTEIMNTDLDPETLCTLVHLFMVMDEREVMRRLEDRLDKVEISASLIYDLVRYYFDKNIFSRCLHYLNRLEPGKESFQSELYRLAIAVEEKELESAVPRLRDLLDRAPSNPYLYKLAGEIYEFEGDTEEAESFYRIAAQINPFLFSDAGSEVRS